MEKSEGYLKSIELLRKAVTPNGFVASPNEKDNYRRIWTRDGVVAGIAALLSGEKDLIECFRRTLITLFQNQHALGFMPSNVMDTGQSSYGGTVGRADNPSWAVVGLCLYVQHINDKGFAQDYRDKVEKCFHVLDVWEYNGRHLVYVPQSGDWADEYFYHGYLLFDQLLRIWALELAANVYKNPVWQQKANYIRKTVETNFWKSDATGALYASNLKHQMQGAPDKFWFMGFNPSRIYNQFDLQANAFAILLSLGNEHQRSRCLATIKDLLEKYNNILPSFYPTAETGSMEMEELRNNFAYEFRNHTHQFHNGGLWPVWNGFVTAALVQSGELDSAQALTSMIHSANRLNNWNFNECLDGKTKQPIGIPFCTWSAAGGIIAENAIIGNALQTKI